MGHGPDNGTNDGRDLVDAIGPDRDDVAQIIVDPFLAADHAAALPSQRRGRALHGGAIERQGPALASEGAADRAGRGFPELQRSCTELQIVELCRQVGDVEKASVAPGACNLDCHDWLPF